LYGVIVMEKRSNTERAGFYLRPIAVLQGFILSQILVLLSSIILALVVYFSSWMVSPRLLSTLTHLGVFGGAILAGWRCHNRAWLHGVVVGLVAFLIYGFVAHGGPLLMTWIWWKGLAKMTFVAMLGGILGGLFSK
jgi:putative membrane protein (TIGR04086 family)